jgi:hypothetical protein
MPFKGVHANADAVIFRYSQIGNESILNAFKNK